MLSKLYTLKNNSGFVRYLKNTSWLLFEHLLRLFAGVLVGIWVARYLGPIKFGVFSYVFAFTSIFSGIAKLGLDGIVVRNLVIEPHKRDIYLGTAFWLKIIGAFIAIIAILFAMLFTSNDLTTNLYITIVASGMLFQCYEVVDFYFQSKILSKFVSACKIVQLVLSSLIKVYFVLTGGDLFCFVLVSLFDQISLACTLAIVYKMQRNGSFYSYFDLKVAIKLLSDSWPLVLSALMAMIYMRIDQIMIKEMLGIQDVGIYSAAVRLSEVWYFLPVIITNSLFPAILSAKSVSKELYYTRLQQLYALMIWSAIFIAVPMTFLSDWLVTMLYGAAYASAGQVLMINIWSGVFVFLSTAFGKFLIADNLAKINFYRTFWGAVINILLNYLLIDIYGVNGAALSTLISLAVVNIGYDMFDSSLHLQFKLKMAALFCPFRKVQ